jgi:peptidoglycan/LPS O-acetylase OafA/YrhL
MATPRLAAAALGPAERTRRDDARASAVPVALDRRHPALDGVRGLAILMVLLFHFVAQTTPTGGVEAVVTGILAYGLRGVDLFFVLSGFLITDILYESRGQPGYFRRFYMRRILRILPLYYAVLAAVFLVLPLVPQLRGTEIAQLRSQQAWAWLFGVNVHLAREGGWVMSYIEHFWTLAVEAHFYLVWPFVVWLLGDRPRALMGTSLGLALAAFAGRIAASAAGAAPVVTTVLTPFQLDALCLGAFFAVYLRQPGGEAAVRRAILPMTAAAAGVLLLDFTIHRVIAAGLSEMRSVRIGLFRVLFAGLLLKAVLAPASSPVFHVFRSRPLRALGIYSYGIYVYHHFLSFYLVKHGTEFALARMVGSHALAVTLQAAGAMAVSIAVAYVSYELFERRFLRLKRLWPSAGRPARLAPRVATP